MSDQSRSTVRTADFIFERHILVVTASRVLAVVTSVLIPEFLSTPLLSIFHCFAFM